MSKDKDKTKGSGKKGLIVLGSVGGFILVLLLVVTILTTTVFYRILGVVIGGERLKYSDEYPLIYTSDYESKADTLEAANALNERVCEEGDRKSVV